MKVKIEYLVLAGIIAALAIYLAMRSTDRTQYELPNIAEVAAGEFTRIEIAHKGSTITLAKKDDAWRLEPQGYPADPGRIKDILATLGTLQTTALASESKDYRRFELDGDRQIRVKAWTGDSLKRNFDVGKAAPSFRHTFIKLDNDHRVYHARDNFRDKFDLDATALQDKTALQLKAAEVSSFVISSDSGKAEFRRLKSEDDQSPPGWRRGDGKDADTAAVEQLLGAVSQLKHQGFIDGTEKSTLTGPLFTFVLQANGSHTLSIFDKLQPDAEKYPATSSQSEFPFLLAAEQVEQIMIGPDDLLPKAAEENSKGREEVPSQ